MGGFFLLTLMALLLILIADATPLDLNLAHAFASPQGFALQDHWLLSQVLHADMRTASRFFLVIFVLGIAWPIGPLRALTRGARARWVLCTVGVLLVVPIIKHYSLTSCPWDLAQFGGAAQWVSHWAWGVADGGPGGCFPAGHASTGLAFVTGYFWLRKPAPKAARYWLCAALLIGLILGFVQQLRGAHYMSHTLWTAWLCWTTAGVLYFLSEKVFLCSNSGNS